MGSRLGVRSRPDLWRRIGAATGSIEKFATIFDGAPSSWMPELRPPNRTHAVILEPDQEIVDALLSAIERVLRSGEDVELQRQEERALLQAARLVERPALFVHNGTFAVPESRWRILERSRPELEVAIAAVGRIEYGTPTTERQLGSGFLVAQDIVLTNRHVVEQFAVRQRTCWSIKSGVRPRIDFKEEEGSEEADQHEISELIYVSESPGPDIAVLGISSAGDRGQSQPTPVRVAERTVPHKDRLVATIGYPKVSDGTDASLERAMLAGKSGVKRIQPGRVVRTKAPVFAHDCTTVSGSSGSCVVAVKDGAAIGIHYWGRTRAENLAVSLGAASARDSRLREVFTAR